MSSTSDRRSPTAPDQARSNSKRLVAAEGRRAARDAQYRAALGLPAGEALPTQLGTVGGSRGGHGGRRVNQTTNGQAAAWNTEARRRAASTRHVLSLDE